MSYQWWLVISISNEENALKTRTRIKSIASELALGIMFDRLTGKIYTKKVKIKKINNDDCR